MMIVMSWKGLDHWFLETCKAVDISYFLSRKFGETALNFLYESCFLLFVILIAAV